MITKIGIHNYKCFLDAELKISSLNLFAGANSSGKSSVIQALRLCLDNLGEPSSKTMVSKDKKTGRFNELRSYLSTQREFSISLSTKEGKVETKYSLGDDDNMLTTRVATSSRPSDLARKLSEMPIFYLPAHRESAKDVFPMNLENGDSIGLNGEYVIDYYAHHKGDVLDDSLIFNKNLKTLEGQVNYWLQQLTGYSLNVTPQGETYIVRYKDRTGFEFRPYHVGTGVSFMAAFLIVCLAAPQKSLIIIENPEIHLHPKAQALAIDFFSVISQTDIQVIIETHSDHLFNGIRRLVAQKKLSKDSASVYFFKMNSNNQESTPVLIDLTDKGRLTVYEPGLFNQFDDDLDAILQAQ